MNFKLLLNKYDDFDPTHEYIVILKDAVAKAFETTDIKSIYSINDADEDDILILISLRKIISCKFLFNKKRKFIFWFQGVSPEEIVFLYGGVYAGMKAIMYHFIEKFVLNRAMFVFFVSEAMRQHYKDKYGYDKKNYFIMPCFNQCLNKSSFSSEKYGKPSFVYAGNMAKWQCPDEMILLFSEIKKKIPEATLTILTSHLDEARALLSKHETEAEIKYVPLENLSAEMSKYKYGFLLRKKIIINEVATPTKMNSYMASGVIPVFSDVIRDFKDVLLPLKHIVVCDDNNYENTVNRILEIEKSGVKSDEILKEYQTVFETYYNRDAYVTAIADKLKSCFAS